MENLISKKKTAEYLKVSLPTLNKFLRKNKNIMVKNKISLKKLNNLIMKSLKGAQKCL